MRILGVDPGFANFGWCIARYDGKELVVTGCGVIRTEKDKRKVLAPVDNVERMRRIGDELEQVMLEVSPISNLVERRISIICAESMSHVPHASSAAKLSLAWGVLAEASRVVQVPILQRSPQEIKKAVTGSKKASKAQMKDTLCKQFPSLSEPLGAVVGSLQEHPVDALGAIVACLKDPAIQMGLRGRE